jgi:hypothetical protein
MSLAQKQCEGAKEKRRGDEVNAKSIEKSPIGSSSTDAMK